MITSGLPTLKERREEHFRNLAKKLVTNPRFANWFEPVRDTGHDTRRKDIYHMPRARTERLRNSPLHAMIRILNSDQT